MRVELMMVETLRVQLPVMTKEMFAERYPCLFLLAMGFLSAEEQRRGLLDDQEVTSPIILGEQLRHDARTDHPLAGCAFALWRQDAATGHASIGRSPRCDITVPDASMSERHGLLSWTPENLFLTDCDSTNGTTVNLDALVANRPRLIHAEDILTLGRYSFQLHSAVTLFEALRMLDLLTD